MTTLLIIVVINLALYLIGHMVGRAHALAAARAHRAGGKDG